MSFCSQLVDLEALVMGELDARDARALRAHIETCFVCATEVEMLTAERALFTHRAEALAVLAPPPALAAVAPPGRASTENTASRSVLPALGRIALRGHFTAACAAALFVVASLSRLGTASVSMAISDDVASIAGDEGASSAMFASYRQPEPLACGSEINGSADRSGNASSAVVRDDGAMTSSSGAVPGEALACVEARTVDQAIDAPTCDPSARGRE